MPSSRSFRFADVAFSVSSSRSSDLDWLSAYLGPDFSPAIWPEQPTREIRVVLVTDPDTHQQLATRLARLDGPRQVVGLALNQRNVPFALVEEDDAAPWLYYEARDTFLRAHDGTVSLLGGPDVRGSRAALMRVVREWAVDRTLHTGGTVVHACAVATTAGVVIVAGTEGAGKTSTLLSLLTQHCAKYVANDRVAVWVDGDSVVARGLPTLLGIRDGTFDLLAAVGDLGVGASARIHGIARTGHEDERRTSSGKVKLTPVDVDHVFGDGTVSEGGPVLGLVLPSVASSALDEASIHRVPAGEWSPERLSALECRRGFDRDIGDVFATDPSADTAARLRASSLAVKRTLVRRVPTVAVSLSPGVPLTCEDWTRIVGHLSGAEPG